MVADRLRPRLLGTEIAQPVRAVAGGRRIRLVSARVERPRNRLGARVHDRSRLLWPRLRSRRRPRDARVSGGSPPLPARACCRGRGLPREPRRPRLAAGAVLRSSCAGLWPVPTQPPARDRPARCRRRPRTRRYLPRARLGACARGSCGFAARPRHECRAARARSRGRVSRPGRGGVRRVARPRLRHEWGPRARTLAGSGDRPRRDLPRGRLGARSRTPRPLPGGQADRRPRPGSTARRAA